LARGRVVWLFGRRCFFAIGQRLTAQWALPSAARCSIIAIRQLCADGMGEDIQAGGSPCLCA
jgi:hypothetical protein